MKWKKTNDKELVFLKTNSVKIYKKRAEFQ